MSDSIVLVCAVLGSTASGVLIAYWICVGMFRAFRMHSEQAEVKKPVSVRVVEG